MSKFRIYSPPSALSSVLPNEDCTGPDYEECAFTTPHLTQSSSASFFFCTFKELTSGSSGGEIYFTSGSSLSIEHCTFMDCSNSIGNDGNSGGGAIDVNAPASLTLTSTLFLGCHTPAYGGAVFVHGGSETTTVSFCVFINCQALHGGGLMTFFWPLSVVSSSHFISCTGRISGGGFYHDSDRASSSLSVSDCLFAHSTAEIDNDSRPYRGGGGFENFRTADYPSKYSFSFFHGNIDKRGNGHDITSNLNRLAEGSIVHCFTTTAINSFCNVGDNETNWLPQGTLSFIIMRTLAVVSPTT